MAPTLTIKPTDQYRDPLAQDLFGGNLVFTDDRTDGTFGEVSADLGLTLIRYPGGAVSEGYFDPTNPDATVGPDGALLPLSEFLAHCAAIGARPTITLPTKRYAGDIDAGVEAVTGFVEKLVAGEWGDASGAILEIGNEYNFGSAAYGVGTISATMYGRIASAFATAIEAAAGDRVTVSVQAGYDAADNATILSHFDTWAEKDAVDTVSFHAYPWRFERVEVAYDKKGALAEAWLDAGVAETSYLSEWNVRSLKNYDPADMDYGLSQAATLVESVAFMAKWGVDYAAAWTVQNNNRTAFASAEGKGVAKIGGAAFELMRETLIGTRLVADMDFSNRKGDFSLHAFEDASKVVLFVTARALAGDSATVTVDFHALTGAAGHGWVETLSAIPGPDGDPDSPLAQPVTEGRVLGARDLDGDLSLSFDQVGEMHRVVLAKAAVSGERLLFRGDAAANNITGSGGDDLLSGLAGHDTLKGLGGDDELTGAWGNDVLSGNRGDDALAGDQGDDWLSGGTGRDTLVGGGGSDKLLGGGGADALVGQAGDDFIFGGDGNDRLRGGSGDDLLDGGAGLDVLIGGGGADRFRHSGLAADGADRIRDYDADEGDLIVVTSGSGDFGLRLEDGHLGSAAVAEAVLFDRGTGADLFRFEDGAGLSRVELHFGGEATTFVF